MPDDGQAGRDLQFVDLARVRTTGADAVAMADHLVAQFPQYVSPASGDGGRVSDWAALNQGEGEVAVSDAVRHAVDGAHPPSGQSQVAVGELQRMLHLGLGDDAFGSDVLVRPSALCLDSVVEGV